MASPEAAAASSSRLLEDATAGRDGELSSQDTTLIPSRRVRHIASIHLRNFQPSYKGKERARDHDPQQLYDISLGLEPQGNPSVLGHFLEPCSSTLHADWLIDPVDLARCGPSSSSSREQPFFAASNLVVSAWSRATDGPAQEAGTWSRSWEANVQLNKLIRLPDGLSSSSLRSLPSNALIIGLRTSLWSDSHEQEKQDTIDESLDPKDSTALKRLSRRIRDHQSIEPLSYYLVPQPGRGRGSCRNDHGRSASVDADEAGGLDPENSRRRGKEAEDAGTEDNGADESGYQSETAFELLTSSSPRRRPGLQHRTSSSRTVKALQKGRQRKSSIKSRAPAVKEGSKQSTSRQGRAGSDDEADNIADSETRRRQKQVERWRLEREREKEVLERSKRETKMLTSYNLEKLSTMVEAQVAVSQELDALTQERAKRGQQLEDPQSLEALRRQVSSTRGRLASLDRLTEEESDRIRQTKAVIATKKEALARRRARLDFVKRELSQQQNVQKEQGHTEINALRSQQSELDIQIHNRRAHLLDRLAYIYPLKLLSASSLLFSICSLPLPNSPATVVSEAPPAGPDRVDEEQIAAALGLTAQLIQLISWYLDTPLPYEIASAGSRAMIRDGISIMNGPRGFPLYSKGVERYRFEYGVFLINKDIEQLMNVHGLPVLDLRHILPNLNNLLLTMSSPMVTTLSRVTEGASKGIASMGGTTSQLGSPRSHDHSSTPSRRHQSYRMTTKNKGDILLLSSSGKNESSQPSSEADVVSQPLSTTVEEATVNGHSFEETTSSNGHRPHADSTEIKPKSKATNGGESGGWGCKSIRSSNTPTGDSSNGDAHS